MKSIWEKWKTFYGRVQEEKPLRFKISVSSLVIIFLGGSLLADANPLNLLMPGSIYPFPAYDSRATVPLYTIERESGKLVKIERPVLLDGSSVDRIFRLSAAVARPSSGLAQNFDHLVYAVPFPDFHLAIQKVWIEKGNLVISLDANSLRHELEERFQGERLETMEEPAALLDGYFKCLTLTLAEADLKSDEQIKFISYSITHPEALDKYKEFQKFSLDARYQVGQ
ncbi:MAG: hypothetical protein KDK25_06690 [Leptospiraceae bacterium]|nr:hypothetical protein [Leptospiraceae bacterium]